MTPEIEFEAGLLERWQPVGPFVMLADPAAHTPEMQARWLSRWQGRCVAWLPQMNAQSSVQAASDLAPSVWAHLRRAPHCALWALGGGTTLDLGKVLRWSMADTSPAPAHWRQNTLPDGAQRHALWCTPTTAGTGSEVSPWATLWDLDMAPARKRSWNPPEGTADLALLDPELSRSCPWRVSRDSALDALSHALESLWNRRADHTSRGQARQAARRILHELPALRERPHDLNMRTRMAHASLLAGLAMASTQTALAHALSYELTLQEGVSHGEACAIWLPMVMELAAERSPRVRADLEVVFEMPVSQALPWFGHWLADLGVQVRDLRAQPAGSAHLAQALASERGSNFIEVGA